jgi:hypothetical protein
MKRQPVKERRELDFQIPGVFIIAPDLARCPSPLAGPRNRSAPVLRERTNSDYPEKKQL